MSFFTRTSASASAQVYDRFDAIDPPVSPARRGDAPERQSRTSSRPIRVMQVVLNLDPGGTERLVIEIVKGLASSVSSVVCCLDAAGGWASELTGRGVPVIALGRQAGFRPELGRRIAELVDEHQIDLLHCHHYTPFVYGQIASLLRRRLPVVFTEHGRLSDAGPSLKRRFVNPIVGLFPSAIYAVSADLRRHMIAEGFLSRRVQVVHNGIDPGVRPTLGARWQARQALALAPEAQVIGTAGRLDPVKNLPLLLESFAAVRTVQPSARLVVIGDGPERASLEALAWSLGIAETVLFTGYRRDVVALLPALDVYVNSSTHEGVSLTILEAMAATLPVVATAVGGTPEVVMDSETGLLVPSRSASGLTAALERLLREPELRRSMGDAGRFRVKRHFSVEAMTTSYLDAYRRCLGD